MHQWFRRAAPVVREARLDVPRRDVVWKGHEELVYTKWRMRVPPFLGATSNILHLCGEFSVGAEQGASVGQA